jgi:SMODS-associated and fused to various effectors sensor domain
MTAKSKASKASKTSKAHQNLSHWDTVMLWVAAGGRCERCRDPLKASSKTFEPLNLAERAHIVGQGGETSPRHDPLLSPALANSIDNIMLLCRDCHKEVDGEVTRDDYPVERLQEMKRGHEERIHYLTSLKAERTRVIAFQTPIQQGQGASPQQRPTILHRKDMHEAILPDRFPDQENPSRINIDLPTVESETHWPQLRELITRKWAKLSTDELDHLSIFCLGKMPAVMHLGHLVGDARSVRIMNVQQGVATRWRSNDQIPADFSYTVRRPKNSHHPAQHVIVVLSLSGTVESQQYCLAVPADAPVYEVSNPEKYRHTDWLIAERQLKDFSKLYRDLLSEIQTVYGQQTIIHLMPAAPTPIVFEVGRQYRPNHHPEMLIYNCVGRQFTPTFFLGDAQ